MELSVWIEEDVKKLTFQQKIFWSTIVEQI